MTLKEIDALIKLCRKSGVTSISVDGVSLTLAPEAPRSAYKRRTLKAAPNPFEQALAEAKDATTKAKLKYLSEQHQVEEAKKAAINGASPPDEFDLLFWSAGNGDGAKQ